jgi:hypothetical protein
MIVNSMFYTRSEQTSRFGYWFLMNGTGSRDFIVSTLDEFEPRGVQRRLYLVLSVLVRSISQL